MNKFHAICFAPLHELNIPCRCLSQTPTFPAFRNSVCIHFDVIATFDFQCNAIPLESKSEFRFTSSCIGCMATIFVPPTAPLRPLAPSSPFQPFSLLMHNLFYSYPGSLLHENANSLRIFPVKCAMFKLLYTSFVKQMYF